MKKIDLPLWSDTFFFTACSWLVSLCILRYYRITLWLALLLCTLLSLLVGAGTFLLLYRGRKKKFLLRQDAEEKEKLMLHLALSSDSANKKLFAPLWQRNAAEEERKKVYLLFCMQPLSADAVADILREHADREEQTGEKSEERICIFCNTLSAEARKLCDEFGLQATEGNEVYAKLKENNLLPGKYICGEIRRRGVKEKIKISLQKKNSRSFFFSGAALLILSLFSFFPLYYVISGCLLLLAASLIRIFGYT